MTGEDGLQVGAYAPEAKRRFVSEEVPFVQFGNRRGLTALQIVDDRQLAAFVKRFPQCFEPDPVRDVMLFIEPTPISQYQGASSASLQTGESA